ncbi:MAG: hypothetical protein K6F51_03615 [Acetatifactor sp.]|nr:hypothetical protein [Acetatifactor sp.]
MEKVNLSELVRQGMKKTSTKAQMEAMDLLEAKEFAFDQKEIELQQIKGQLESKITQLAKNELLLDNAKLEATKQKEFFQKEIEKFADLQNAYEVLEKKVKTAYTSKDLSAYLNQVIKEFNESSASDSEVATYVINNMDVDLKVRIFGDEKDSLRFCAPNVTESTEDSLSSIKISIQAIPK